ncbi:heme oxygenase (biliverdin-producing) [Beijerinckia sp. L45]|uniref:biliverdin-producing heme oxygenase n=1 Tax=Beijerinckia sp. L45 TaxID=1641855 RepID=UPI00131E754F|nr:biliverdin-producing heme oxygenase [Beijerinckia sp. L45]
MTAQAADFHAIDTGVQAPTFAAVLRERTQAIHREAERSGYIADLLRGRATRFGYAMYVASLLPAYEAMERHLSVDSPIPALRAFAAPGLARSAALRHDLHALASASDGPMPILPEAQAYADAVAAQGESIGLVAHAYARYLGDLSGGQILKPLLARTLGLEPAQLTFYDFPAIADIAACKTALREALDTIVPGTSESEHVVAEALAAFRHTIAVSTAVSTAMLGAD